VSDAPQGRPAIDAETFARCIQVGGVAVFPADTVYGLACEPDTPEAVERLYAIKGRRPDKPAAVMFFDPELAFAALPELEPRTRDLLARLLPGALTALLPNPLHRFPLACGPDPDTLGVRVPALTGPLEPLRRMRWPVLQSSANPAGGADARRLEDVPESIRREADLVLDGGELAGTASTVLDLRRYEAEGEWTVVRPGPLTEEAIAAAAAAWGGGTVTP
jgi:L-threonylcarbamoyladenylate synthase